MEANQVLVNGNNDKDLWDGVRKVEMLSHCPTLSYPRRVHKPLTITEAIIANELKTGRQLDPTVDLKKLRRTIANRLSAQRYRIKNVEYIKALEKEVNLQKERLSYLKEQVPAHKDKKKMLTIQNGRLEEQLEVLKNRSMLRQVEIEAKEVEKQKLKELNKNKLQVGFYQQPFDQFYDQLQSSSTAFAANYEEPSASKQLWISKF